MRDLATEKEILSFLGWRNDEDIQKKTLKKADRSKSFKIISSPVQISEVVMIQHLCPLTDLEGSAKTEYHSVTTSVTGETATEETPVLYINSDGQVNIN